MTRRVSTAQTFLRGFEPTPPAPASGARARQPEPAWWRLGSEVVSARQGLGVWPLVDPGCDVALVDPDGGAVARVIEARAHRVAEEIARRPAKPVEEPPKPDKRLAAGQRRKRGR